MHKIYDLKETLCRDLEEYGMKDKLDLSELEIVDTLAHAIKNIDRIIEVYEEQEYGEEASRMAYPWNIMNRGGSYSDGRRMNYNRYSRGRGSYENNYRRPRNDGYSRAEQDMDAMINELKDMMQDLPSEKQREVQKFIQRIEQM